MKILFVFFALLSVHFCKAQYKKDTLDPPHPYKKSMYLSSICPGLGQARNARLSSKKFKQAYWKIPVIYGLLGTSVYMILENNRMQNTIKKEYFSREAGNPAAQQWLAYDSYGLIALQQQYLNNRDLFILLTLGLHGLQILDAGVEAHFLTFNVDEKLSLQLKPKIHKSLFLMTASLTF